MLDLLKAHQGDSDHGLKALRELVDNCPTCILAALRQSGLCSYHGEGEDYCPPLIGTEEFDYEKEHASVWAERIDPAQEFFPCEPSQSGSQRARSTES